MSLKILEKCTLCPHECNINRMNKEIGYCRATDKIKIALANLHYYEEPCIVEKVDLELCFFLDVICLANFVKTIK